MSYTHPKKFTTPPPVWPRFSRSATFSDERGTAEVKMSTSKTQQRISRTIKLVIVPVSARQFGIKDMLEFHAGVEDFGGGAIVWEVTRVGLRPTLSL